MLGEIRKDQVRRDGGDLIKPRLSEFAFDVVLLGEAEAPVGLDAGIGGLKGSVGREHFGHVGFRAGVLTELGTLELWMKHTNSDRRWKIEFQVRTQ